jgi:hypothetical protein
MPSIGITSLNNQRRKALALALCLGSATLAVYLVIHGRSRAWTIFDLGCVWTITGDWLGRRLYLFGLSVGQIRAEAGVRSLMPQGLARTMAIGGNLLLAAAAVMALN